MANLFHLPRTRHTDFRSVCTSVRAPFSLSPYQCLLYFPDRDLFRVLTEVDVLILLDDIEGRNPYPEMIVVPNLGGHVKIPGDIFCCSDSRRIVTIIMWKYVWVVLHNDDSPSPEF